MTEIEAFIEARQAEREALAQACIRGGDPAIGTPGQWNAYLEGGDDGWAIEDDAAGEDPGIIGLKAPAHHIAYHDPAWALRDIKAKRHLLKVHQHVDQVWIEEMGAVDGYYLVDEGKGSGCINCHDIGCGQIYADGPCETLRIIASEDEQHADFKPEWRIDG